MSIGSSEIEDFVLWRLGDLTHYGLADVPAESVVVEDRHFYDTQITDIAGGGGQLFWGNAAYVAADLADSGPVSEQAGIRDACAVAAFGFLDLAASRLAAAGLPIESQ